MRLSAPQLLVPIAIAAMFAWLPAAGNTQTTAAPVVPPAGSSAPVTINSCGPIINDKNATTNILGVPVPASMSSGIQIEFVNNGGAAATLVNFAVDSAGDHFVIRDVGTFSPGISIKHQFRNGQGQAFVLPAFIAPNVTCHVASVQFSDGSVWRPGQAPAAAAQAGAPAHTNLQASPARVSVDMASDFELFFVQSNDHVTAFKEIDDCAKVAAVALAISGDSTATFRVKPLAPGSCTAHVIDENGNTLAVPITVTSVQ
ncbi:MAG: hypothetical protein JO098_08110 [Candidatus Eremiobacteraeota bacterium]|nr:hypothetical protein [Candidatus Eremiobacteraeota bacterium]